MSSACPLGLVALLDAGGVAYGGEGVRTAVSEQTSLEMVDDSADGATTQVSLHETNSVALLSEVSTNWRRVRDGAAYIDDADYSGTP